MLKAWAELEKEREERKEAELSVGAFERQLASIKEQCALLDVEIEQRRAVVNNLRRGASASPSDNDCPDVPTERERERSLLNAHASRTSPELTECEFRLRSVIEGIDKDKILVRFTHVDPADAQREFSVVIDVSGDTYKSLCLQAACMRHADVGGQFRRPVPSCRTYQYSWTNSTSREMYMRSLNKLEKLLRSWLCDDQCNAVSSLRVCELLD